MPILVVDARDRFLTALAGVTEPEEKRRIIGRVFIEVFEAEATQLTGIEFLAQGTLYPDVIESAGEHGPSEVIKSHHNVGGLPERLDFELVEPVRNLFKDEVRQLGRELGLPEEFISRHPFPGSRSRRSCARGGDAGTARDPARRRCHPHRGAAREWLVPEGEPGAGGAAAGPGRSA